MNNRSLTRALAIAALAFATAAAIAIGAYNAGVAHGIAESGRPASDSSVWAAAIPVVFVIITAGAVLTMMFGAVLQGRLESLSLSPTPVLRIARIFIRTAEPTQPGDGPSDRLRWAGYDPRAAQMHPKRA